MKTMIAWGAEPAIRARQTDLGHQSFPEDDRDRRLDPPGPVIDSQYSAADMARYAQCGRRHCRSVYGLRGRCDGESRWWRARLGFAVRRATRDGLSAHA